MDNEMDLAVFSTQMDADMRVTLHTIKSIDKDWQWTIVGM